MAYHFQRLYECENRLRDALKAMREMKKNASHTSRTSKRKSRVSRTSKRKSRVSRKSKRKSRKY